jgi:hypothetical protein
VEALKRGTKLIGGAPRYHKDSASQIRRIFEPAREFDVNIDMHLDVAPSAEHMDIHLVCELPGDAVVLNATTPERAVAEIAHPLACFKNGKRTVAWDLPQLMRSH